MRLVALLALVLALVVPRAEAQRAAISRSGVLGGADYLIAVPENWRGGLVVFAHGIQRGPGPGAVAAPPLGLEQSYRRRTIAAGTGHLLVQRVMRAPSHCGFDGETREQAFDDLVAWIERGVRPEGEDVLAPDLSRLGLKWTLIPYPEDPLFARKTP